MAEKRHHRSGCHAQTLAGSVGTLRCPFHRIPSHLPMRYARGDLTRGRGEMRPRAWLVSENVEEPSAQSLSQRFPARLPGWHRASPGPSPASPGRARVAGKAPATRGGPLAISPVNYGTKKPAARIPGPPWVVMEALTV